ncbi:MAG: AbrB/MazE/SpoVT family DNA-binding domain-containing protein [Gemmatimonadota bacterium]|nr:AbrB/MazE/SpoVT family DNA-binding domain-containing protein [Gemmatimonadota bacterium]
MAKWNLKLIRTGNSRCIRLPRALLDKYGWGESLVLEETDHGVLLSGTGTVKLSWKETYCAMATSNEDWSDFDATVADGLE